MKHPTPNASGTHAPLWRAAAGGRLMLPYCSACARHHWPVRARCPHCRGGCEWREASGRGCIAAFSVVRRAANPELAAEAPYVVAFVELDEGVRLFANIVGADPAYLRAGMRVRARFETALDADVRVPVFAPEEP
jgi:uncharacterized OB-fold protein